jgi:hypothetical protein
MNLSSYHRSRLPPPPLVPHSAPPPSRMLCRHWRLRFFQFDKSHLGKTVPCVCVSVHVGCVFSVVGIHTAPHPSLPLLSCPLPPLLAQASDAQGNLWKVKNSTWSGSQRMFANIAVSADNSLWLIGGAAGFDRCGREADTQTCLHTYLSDTSSLSLSHTHIHTHRFFADIYRSIDGGTTWTDATSSGATWSSGKHVFIGKLMD